MSQRLLIVEDEDHLAAGLKLNLELEGYEVDVAGTAREASEKLVQPEGYDALVLDVMLPDINGKEVCQRVRSDSALDDVRIICISGMVEADKIDDLKEAGANEFMQKPFEVDTLFAAVCGLLDIEVPA